MVQPGGPCPSQKRCFVHLRPPNVSWASCDVASNPSPHPPLCPLDQGQGRGRGGCRCGNGRGQGRGKVFETRGGKLTGLFCLPRIHAHSHPTETAGHAEETLPPSIASPSSARPAGTVAAAFSCLVMPSSCLKQKNALFFYFIFFKESLLCVSWRRRLGCGPCCHRVPGTV